MQIMEKQSTSGLEYTLLCGLSSFVATLASGIVHPLELIKTRFQSHDGSHNQKNLVPKYGGFFSAIKTIVEGEGFFGLYKGFYINFLSQSSAQALFFAILIYYRQKADDHLSAVGKASFEASILATFITQPLWVVRTRMLLTTDKVNQKDNFKQNAANLYKEYGFRGFFRGMTLSIMLSMTGFIQMYSYQGCKLIFQNIKHQQNDSLTSYILNMRAFTAGGIAKFISSLVMYPLTTIRTRYQQTQFITDSIKPKYTSTFDIVRKIVSQQGIHGFYKGFTINLVKGFIQRAKKTLGIQHIPSKKKE